MVCYRARDESGVLDLAERREKRRATVGLAASLVGVACGHQKCVCRGSGGPCLRQKAVNHMGALSSSQQAGNLEATMLCLGEGGIAPCWGGDISLEKAPPGQLDQGDIWWPVGDLQPFIGTLGGGIRSP